MNNDYMVKLTNEQVDQLMGVLDDYIEFKWDGYGSVRGTWNSIFHRMKVDDDFMPLYAIKYDEQKKKHVVVEIPV